MQELSLLVPAFKYSRQVDFSKIHDSLPLLPHLSLALSRSQRSNVAVTGYESVFGNLLGLKPSGTTGFPVAAYTYLVDSGQAKKQWYLRADPVCLQPDRDRVLMVNANLKNITMADAQAVAEEINRLYCDEAWQFVTPHPQRWYILLKDEPCIETASIDQVIGQDIHGYLPTGPNQNYWRSILNEIQMLLHNHSVNFQRNSQDMQSINSLWIWGGGKLPELEVSVAKSSTSAGNCVWSNDALCQGIAKYHNINYFSLPQNAEDWLDSCRQFTSKQCNHALVVMDNPTQKTQFDFYEWLDWLAQWQDTWIRPLLIGLKSGQIEKINFHICNGQMYSLSRADLRKWWRFKRPWYVDK